MCLVLVCWLVRVVGVGVLFAVCLLRRGEGVCREGVCEEGVCGEGVCREGVW